MMAFEQNRVGLIAGRGVYPRILAERLSRTGHEVFVAGLSGQFSSQCLKDIQLEHRCFKLGEIAAIASYFRSRGISEAYMAGGVERRGAVGNLKLDTYSACLLPLALLKGDDFLLREVAGVFGFLGIEIASPTHLLADLFIRAGESLGPDVDERTMDELLFATREAKFLGAADRGQAVVSFDGRIVCKEGRDGTGAMIARAPGPGAVMAKVRKPNQDVRFDVPAIGPSTITMAGMVGLKAIAIEAGGVLMLEKIEIEKRCVEQSVSLVAI